MELWDIYDRNKKRTGRTMERNNFTLADDEYHLTVLGVIARPDKTFLITKRVMTKAWAPGWWEVSGGAAQAGEESEEAVKREILEETGLDITGAEGGYLFSYHRENPGKGDNYFVDIYKFVGDFTEAEVKAQEEETDGFMLATVEEIEQFAKEGDFIYDYSLYLENPIHDEHIYCYPNNINIWIQYSLPIIRKLAKKEKKVYRR